MQPVTLACVDCLYPRLGARALALSLAQVPYERALLLTDDTAVFADLDPRITPVEIAPLRSLAEYSRFILKELGRHVATDFVQLVQWDGYVTRGEAWTDEFLACDYIGARWPFRPPGQDVGNGGFSLRSRRLLEALQDERIRPSETEPEDNIICVEQRAWLEQRHGIRFATPALADRYAFEVNPATGREFGFHALYNLPYFNDEASLAALFEAIPPGRFCSPGTVSLVRRLIQLGRKREALRYAKRVRSEAANFAALAAGFRGLFEHMVLNLVSRTEPCPCGSGAAYKRCCGAVANWSAV